MVGASAVATRSFGIPTPIERERERQPKRKGGFILMMNLRDPHFPTGDRDRLRNELERKRAGRKTFPCSSPPDYAGYTPGTHRQTQKKTVHTCIHIPADGGGEKLDGRR